LRFTVSEACVAGMTKWGRRTREVSHVISGEK
jgi:hypothetical protein